MTQTELVVAVAEKTGMTRKQARQAVAGMMEAIQEALAAGQEVRLVGFGVYQVRERAARKGRDPQTGRVIEIPAKRAVVFRPGKELRDAVR